MRMSVTLSLDKDWKYNHLREEKPLQSKKKIKNLSPLSYTDLLIVTLTQHEKELYLITEKLEKISEKLEEISLHLTEKEKS